MRSVNEGGNNVPAFLQKLCQLVDNPDINLISWSPGGTTFIIHNQAEFAKELLPLYYKHNNMASFIRQLNMYGFHKVMSMENGSLKCDKDEMIFSHPCFVQGSPNLLQHIKRKIANPKMVSGEDLKPELMNRVISDVKQMKGRQESMDARFSVMKQENEALWREVAVLRQKHMKQQQIVNNLIQFLMSLVQPSRNSSHNPGVKRKYQLMINNAAHNSEDQSDERSLKQAKLGDHIDSSDIEHCVDCGPIIHELPDHDLLPGEDVSNETNPRYIKVEVPSLSPRPFISSPLSNSLDGDPISPLLLEEPILPDDVSQDSIDPTLLLSFNNNKNIQSIPEKTLSPQTYPISANFKNSKKQLSDKISPTENIRIPLTSGSKGSNTSLKGKTVSTAKSVGQPTYSVPVTPVLPSNIFAEDESLNDGTSASQNDREAATALFQNAAAEYVNSSDPPSNNEEVNDQIANYLSNLTSGNYGSISNNLGADQNAIDKKTKRKNKKKSNTNESSVLKKKTTSDNLRNNEESSSQQNMSLVSVDNSDNLPFSVSEVDDHLDTMQSDLDSLRELLRGDSYSLDANTLLGLFAQDDPFYGLSMNCEDQNANKAKEGSSDAEQSGQLMWYIPPSHGLDFTDMSLIDGNQENGPNGVPETLPPLVDDLSALNTPQMEISAPSYKQQVT